MSTSGFAISNIAIYGVRKADIEAVKLKSNWIDLESHIESTLAKMTPAGIRPSLMNLDNRDHLVLLSSRRDALSLVSDANSEAVKTVNGMGKSLSRYTTVLRTSLQVLFSMYSTSAKLEAFEQALANEVAAFDAKYPLMPYIQIRAAPSKVIADYINLCDSQIKS
jgi:hypothetical protein